MTKLEISNASLVRIGQRILQSLDEDTNDARLVNTLLDDSILEVLREAKPHSARKRVKLVQLPDAPLFGYSSSFKLPADYVGGLECYDSRGDSPNHLYWEIEGDTILTDAELMYARYVHYPDDINILDVLTSRAISLKLAIQMAYSKTEDKALVDGLITEYEQLMLQKARSLDTVENRADTTFGQEMDWVQSRNINFKG